MPGPELGLAAFQASSECIRLLVLIIRTAVKARRLKAECAEAERTASILKAVLDSNSNSIALMDPDIVTKLSEVLREILEFVNICQSSNLFDRLLEVSWKNRLPRLLKELMTWIAYFTMQTTSTAREDILNLINSANESKFRAEADMDNVLKILDELKKDLAGKQPGGLEIAFSQDDSRLSMTEVGGNILAGSLELGDGGLTDVVGIPIQEDLMRFGEKGPRHVLIYGHLSASTLVHPFWGIAERFDHRWAIMKDLRQSPSLMASIKAKSLPESPLKRLQIVHDIVKTVAYLHSVKILVKRLSDETTLLWTDGQGMITPYLTDLERARLFLEHTSGGTYDVRYEAPEFQKIPRAQHSEATDIWSMGVLIWQCIFEVFPFGFEDEVVEGEEAAKIRKAVLAGTVPWNTRQDDPLLARVIQLVRHCCHARPERRPKSADVEHSIFNLMTLAALGIELNRAVDETTKPRVAVLLEKHKAKCPGPLKLEKDDVADLSKLVKQGDFQAALYLGEAIYHNLANLEDEMDRFLFINGKDNPEVIRAHAALKYLELAMQAGYKEAAELLMKAHGKLALFYKAEYKSESFGVVSL